MKTNYPIVELNWSDVSEYSSRILVALKERKVQIDTLVPILRGGIPLATLISHNIDHVQTSCMHIKRSFNEYANTEFSEPTFLGLTNKSALCGKNLLVIEDIIDKGVTVRFALDILKKYKPISVTVATLINFTNNNDLDIIAGYNLNKDTWFIFPWEQKLNEKD